MSVIVVKKTGQKANPRDFLLMHARGLNAADVIGTAVVTWILYGLLMGGCCDYCSANCLMSPLSV